MGIVFESQVFKDDPGVTATHVLLVGCGEYPGLAAAKNGLHPLTPPRLSVEAMANWFLSGRDAMPAGREQPPEKAFYNPHAPLGSLAILASPAGSYTLPSGEVIACTRPTLANLKAATHKWLERLGENPNSRGIFYFCGHGLSDGTVQHLVADDVMEIEYDPWGPLFHVSNTCQAAIRATPATLAFWIDACMEFNEQLLNNIGAPQSLIHGTRSGPPKTKDWSLIGATTMNRKAYAPERGVARFTEALLRALQGHCGTQCGMAQDYSVGASDLRTATAEFLDLLQQGMEGEPQALGGFQGDGPGSTALHILPNSPRVHVEMDIDPPGYRVLASAYMENLANPRELKKLGDGPARFLKERGEWTYGALFNQDRFPDQTHRRLLTSAVLRWQFKVPE
ncbi:caspase family protein [Pseudomonas sp. GD03944]|uniref:caspase family protein n=1 Tax=Pseudomonas sp. GD03944 TaxID=2975409 RepID=UPI00244935F4|nr:caspase family protein [Pseudomonas sp. GD03944]MDH1264717.1 caspase family protein [Pseudomonas sp. GD03944]